ncbi:RsbT antagonist protein RsbS [subsurface metagenome]
MARLLNETATMVQMLGTEVVICGMQPSVALTLVEMGRELIGVKTALNLDQGLDVLRQIIEERTGSGNERD